MNRKILHFKNPLNNNGRPLFSVEDSNRFAEIIRGRFNNSEYEILVTPFDVSCIDKETVIQFGFTEGQYRDLIDLLKEK